MKKSTIAIILILLSICGYILYDSRYGQSLLMSLLSGDRSRVEEISLAFMEDIRFKDFQSAASHHSPEDRLKADIPKLMERLFKIKPELLDIMACDILHTDIDSTGARARVKMRVKVNVLNSGKIQNPEFILYFHKENDTWYMDLESSLHATRTQSLQGPAA